MKKKYSSKRFLNLSGFHSIAAIGIDIDDPNERYGVYGSIHISDCSRSISLELNVHNEEEIDNSINKLRVLQEECEKAQKYLTANKEQYIKTHAEKKEEDKTRLEKLFSEEPKVTVTNNINENYD